MSDLVLFEGIEGILGLLMENNNNFWCVFSWMFLFAGVYQNIVLLVDRMCEKDSEGRSARRSRKRDMFENLKICYHPFLCCSSPPSYNVTSPPFGKQLVSSPQESEPPLTQSVEIPHSPRLQSFLPYTAYLTIPIPCTKTSQRLQLPSDILMRNL